MSGVIHSHVHTHAHTHTHIHTHKHFPVRWNGKEFSFGSGKFSTIMNLLDHFESELGTSGDAYM